MKKYLKNGCAFIRGLIFIISIKFKNKIEIKSKLRIFKNVEFTIDKGANMKLGKNVKIRERSFISTRKNSILILGDNTSIGMDSKIVCHDKIEIGEGTLISPNVLIYDHDHLFTRENGVERKKFNTSPIIIGENCWIGANTVILRGTKIGDNCVIGAGSVVKGNYPQGSIIVQNREVVIK